jgi:hypothetical protein
MEVVRWEPFDLNKIRASVIVGESFGRSWAKPIPPRGIHRWMFGK